MFDKPLYTCIWSYNYNNCTLIILIIIFLIIEVVKKCNNFRGPENRTDFKIHMIEVLRAAKQRHRNITKKNVAVKNKKKVSTAAEHNELFQSDDSNNGQNDDEAEESSGTDRETVQIEEYEGDTE